MGWQITRRSKIIRAFLAAPRTTDTKRLACGGCCLLSVLVSSFQGRKKKDPKRFAQRPSRRRSDKHKHIICQPPLLLPWVVNPGGGDGRTTVVLVQQNTQLDNCVGFVWKWGPRMLGWDGSLMIVFLEIRLKAELSMETPGWALECASPRKVN